MRADRPSACAGRKWARSAPDLECRVSGVGGQGSGIRHQVSGVRHQASGVRCRASGVRRQVSGVGCQENPWDVDIARRHRDTPCSVACADPGKRFVPARSGSGRVFSLKPGKRRKRCIGETEQQNAHAVIRGTPLRRITRAVSRENLPRRHGEHGETGMKKLRIELIERPIEAAPDISSIPNPQSAISSQSPPCSPCLCGDGAPDTACRAQRRRFLAGGYPARKSPHRRPVVDLRRKMRYLPDASADGWLLQFHRSPPRGVFPFFLKLHEALCLSPCPVSCPDLRNRIDRHTSLPYADSMLEWKYLQAMDIHQSPKKQSPGLLRVPGDRGLFYRIPAWGVDHSGRRPCVGRSS